MEIFVASWAIGLAVLLFVAYWLIRTAVHHGIIDADNERSRRAHEAEVRRTLREKPSRYVDHDPDV